MPVSVRLRTFFFGLFAAVIAAAWVRGGVLALGGDAFGLDVAVCGLLLCFGIGAAIGARWTLGTRSRWWPFLAIFGLCGGMISMLLPSLSSTLQGIYHALGGGLGAALASLLAWVSLAIVPWGCAGIAFARMTAGSDGQIIMPMALGGAAGVVALDLILGPFLGGLFLLLLASLGICALAVGLDGPPPLVRRNRDDILRPILFAGLTGWLLGLAGKSGFLLLLQFFPASRPEIGWIQALLLTGVALGSLGFGNPASMSARPMLWTWVFVGLIGVALGASLAIANFLQEPGNYRYYFSIFHAGEGSMLQGFLLVAAMGALPSLALGAALRTLSDPAAEPGRPSTAASTSALALGAALGLATASGLLIPATGITGCLKIALVLLIGLGALGILLVGEAGNQEKGLGVGVCALGVAFLLPVLPYQIEAKNAYAPGTLAVRERAEGPDGIAQATLEPGRLTELWWNHNPAGGGEEMLEKTEIALTALISQGPDRALCMSAVTPSQWEWMREAGIAHVDLCPRSPILGDLALRLEQPRATSAAVLRAAAGLQRTYPLIVAFSEPLWPANASSFWNAHAFDTLREKLTDNGCFVLWLRPRECSAAALRQIARGFAEAFPSAEATLAFAGFHGPSLALVGRRKDAEPASSGRAEQVFQALREKPAFSSIPLARAGDALKLRLASRERILETTAGAARHWGPFVRTSWDLQPRFRTEQQLEGIAFLVALATRASSGSTDGSLEAVAALRLTLMGFQDRLRNQPTQEGWMSSLEEGGLEAAELQRFLEALELNPSFSPLLSLWNAIGERALRSGSAATALPYLAKASATAPQHGFLHYWHGRALLESGLAQIAIEPLRKASELDSQIASRWHYLGRAVRASGDLREAVKNFARARELEPGNAANLAELALCYRDLGDAARARETLEAARAIAPEEPAVRAAVEKMR